MRGLCDGKKNEASGLVLPKPQHVSGCRRRVRLPQRSGAVKPPLHRLQSLQLRSGGTPQGKDVPTASLWRLRWLVLPMRELRPRTPLLLPTLPSSAADSLSARSSQSSSAQPRGQTRPPRPPAPLPSPTVTAPRDGSYFPAHSLSFQCLLAQRSLCGTDGRCPGEPAS